MLQNSGIYSCVREIFMDLSYANYFPSVFCCYLGTLVSRKMMFVNSSLSELLYCTWEWTTSGWGSEEVLQEPDRDGMQHIAWSNDRTTSGWGSEEGLQEPGQDCTQHIAWSNDHVWTASHLQTWL